jgi:trehalose 2-sulfotransferase
VRTLPTDDPRTSIRQSYVICTTPRSGSNFLCEVLQTSAVAGRPDEYLWDPPAGHERWSVSEIRSYVERIHQAGTTPNGIFGIKIMWSYLGDWIPRFAALAGRDELSPPEALTAVFPNVRYIWLTRRDKVRQGISFHRAIETKRWRSTDPDDGSTSGPAFDFAAIGYLVKLAISEDRAWETFFREHGIEPLVVVYEDLEQSPALVAERILQFLQLSPLAPALPRSWRHQRQADGLTEDWVRQYQALKRSAPG